MRILGKAPPLGTSSVDNPPATYIPSAHYNPIHGVAIVMGVSLALGLFVTSSAPPEYRGQSQVATRYHGLT